MGMRSILGVVAAIFGLLGLAMGIVEWTLQILILPEGDWPDALWSMAHFCWIGHILMYGGAIICIGFAVAMKTPNPEPVKVVLEQPASSPPPPKLPASATASAPSFPAPRPKPAPVEETRAAADLWQSADAPFPAPPSIEHPSSGPSLWQSDQAPFPKVDIPKEAEEAVAREKRDS